MYGHRNPAGGLFIRHADNVVIDSFQVSHREADHRPSVVLDDVRDADISGIRTSGSDYPGPFLQMESSRIRYRR